MESIKQNAEKTYIPQLPLGFKEATNTCFRKYFDFNGRARGSEYWYFQLFIALISFVGVFLDIAFFGIDNLDTAPIGTIISLSVFIPLISVATRRLHDSGKSGWWQLLYLTGFGAFVVLYWLIRSGDDHENDYI